MNNTTNLSSLIWSSADDVLRGLFKPSEYGRVILPFVVMRRLDCVLEPKKDEVFELFTKYKDQLSDPTPVILRQVGYPFFNSSKFDLSRIKSDPNNVLMNFNNYVQGYSKNVLDIIENFSINPLVEKLHKNKRLYLLIDKFTEFDLHPNKIDNHQMGSVYEELLRKFSEMSNEESGDHFTPRDVVKLLVSFVFGGDRKDLQGEGKIRSVYDPCCGTGGMLTIGKEWIHENINPHLKVDLYGQELNDVTYSICKSDLLMMDENPENIHGPCSSISDDRLQGRKFDYMITNPPFGVSWKSEEEFVTEEAKDPNGRFFVGTPTVKDGSLIFLQHLIHKMSPEGSRIGIVFNNSPNQTGDAGSGESEIRKWIIENDWLETVISLPTQLFFNTPLRTYIWIVTNKKQTRRKGKVQLINGLEYYERMRKYLGNKGKFITEEHSKKLFDLYERFEDGPDCKIMLNQDFRYFQIESYRPVLDKNGEPVVNKNGKVNYDKETKQIDLVPNSIGIETYFKTRIKPQDSQRCIDESKTRIGYEIPFIKLFYEVPKLRSPEEIRESLNEVSHRIGELDEEVSTLSGLITTITNYQAVENVDDLQALPSGWIVKEFRDVVEERSVKVNDTDYPPLSVTKTGIYPQLDDVVKSDDHDNRKLVLADDYVINSRSDRKGSSGLSALDGSVSTVNIVLNIKFPINPKYFQYFMKSHWFKEVYYKYGNGIHEDVWSTRFSKLKLLNVFFPSSESQKLVVDFLSRLDELTLELISQQQSKSKLDVEYLESIKHYLIVGERGIKNERS